MLLYKTLVYRQLLLWIRGESLCGKILNIDPRTGSWDEFLGYIPPLCHNTNYSARILPPPRYTALTDAKSLKIKNAPHSADSEMSPSFSDLCGQCEIIKG